MDEEISNSGADAPIEPTCENSGDEPKKLKRLPAYPKRTPGIWRARYRPRKE